MEAYVFLMCHVSCFQRAFMRFLSEVIIQYIFHSWCHLILSNRRDSMSLNISSKWSQSEITLIANPLIVA